MKKAFSAWVLSLGIVARSYLTVVVLAVLLALWGFAAYEWLGLPESSALVLVLALLWALLQIFASVTIIGGSVMSSTVAATTERDRLHPYNLIWTGARFWKGFLDSFLFCLLSCVAAGLLGECFGWINAHSVEVASFLTFHSQKPVSHLLLENIYAVVEGLIWFALAGFLLSLFMVAFIGGWGAALRQRRTLLARCAFGIPFISSLLSVAIFGGGAYALVTWYPRVPPGFWDYAQMMARFSLSLILVAAGWLFWALSLARLTIEIGERRMSVTVRPRPTDS